MTRWTALVTLLLAGCGGAESDLPDGVQLLNLSAPDAHWARPTVIEVTPGAHLPSASPDAATVTIYVELPDDGQLAQVETTDGRSVLQWPAGSVADRVERWGPDGAERIVDVRGTRIDADGRRWHHVYKPTEAGVGAELLGAEWPADDPELTRVAVDAFLEALADTPTGRSQKHLERYLAGVRAKLDCEGCHQPLRADNTVVREHGLVARGTDAAGWFTPTTLFAETTPLETYGAWDHNLDDPFVELSCEGGAAHRPAKVRGAHARCADGTVARARYDLASALAAGEPRAEAVCASWLALAERLPHGAPADHPCVSEEL